MAVTKTKFRYEKYTGCEKEVRLPESVDGMPLSVIGAKAFLSCKNTERLVLPASLEAVEDWAFAHMKNLREVVLPAKNISFGKKVFLGCENLERIVFSDVPKDSSYEGIGCFLASAFRFFAEETLQSLQSAGLIHQDLVNEYPDDILFHLKAAGDCKEQWKWILLYDKALETFLQRSDDDGFVPAFIGWFDVEDVEDQRQAYCSKRREDKISLAFQRLFYSQGMEQESKDFLHRYIRENSPFIPNLFLHSTALGRNICYYKIWSDAGGLTPSYARQMMDELPETEPELRSYLLELQIEKSASEGGIFTEWAL